MSTVEYINRHIVYARGPEGQTVVIVPPRQVRPDKPVSCACRVCVGCTAAVAAVCLLLGIVYGAIALAVLGPHDFFSLNGRNEHSKLVSISLWLLGVGGIFLFILLCIHKCIERRKQKRRIRFMYTAGESDSQTTHLMQDVTQDQSSLGGQGELHFPGHEAFPEGARYPSSPSGHQVPSEGYDPALYNSERRSPSRHQDQFYQPARPFSSRYQAQFYQPASPSRYQTQIYQPGSPSSSRYQAQFYQPASPSSSRYQDHFYQPGRAYPGVMSSEFSSPLRSSPVTERSFSPASGTTYLSYHSTRPETHNVPMN
ncbi:DNA-directed RNA polymerase II subunit RPB1-like [Macrobrachium nipponense]|uniref:DNA-directed RNA polymerase II subunit RPB1-like n=1 Tax=Macrobrachium nipponense TaxID=159736 RepID=UPI0030C7D39E